MCLSISCPEETGLTQSDASAPQDRAPREASRRALLRGESIASVLNTLIRWTGLVLIAFFAYRSIDVLAGETTGADIGISVGLLASVPVSQAVAWILGAGGMAFGLLERRLRKNTIERLQSRIKSLETQADPGRTSSLLTPRGETRQEDKL